MPSRKRTIEQEETLRDLRVWANAIPSTEEVLRDLRENRLKAELDDLVYEALRDEAVARLKDEGGFRYVEYDGVKYRAAPKGGGGTDIDIGVLEDELEPEMFDQVTSRVVDRAAFTQAVAADKIPATVLIKAVKEKSGRPFVHFEPADPALSKRPKD